MKNILVALSLLTFTVLFAEGASARNGGIYLELAPSYGFFSSDELLTGVDAGPTTPPSGFVPQLKLGVNLFGWAGVEVDAAGVYWDLDSSDRGGGGFLGGVVRITPLEILTYVISPDVEIPSLVPKGPVNWKNRPFDLGLYFGGGYSLIGEDFAYEGGYLKYGFDVKFFITPQFALGFDLPFRSTLYRNFRYTNYNDKIGFCTEGGDIVGGVVSDDANCSGEAPKGLLIAPALTITGVFDFGI